MSSPKKDKVDNINGDSKADKLFELKRQICQIYSVTLFSAYFANNNNNNNYNG